MQTHDKNAPLEAPIEPDLGRWKVKRNLHYWILGLIIAVLAVFMLADALESERPSDAVLAEQARLKEKQNAALNKAEQAPSRESLEQTMARQKKDALERSTSLQVPQSAEIPVNLVPAQAQLPRPLNLPQVPPGMVRPDSGLPTPDAMQQSSNHEQMAAKREEQILASPIMAIDNGSAFALGAGKGARAANTSSLDRATQEFAEERDRRQAASRADRDQMFNKALSSAGSMAGGGNSRPAQPGFYESLATPQDNAQDVLRPTASRGRFSLMQGAIIPCVLVTEIRSDLPGEFMARTTMDVYDSVYGTALLIPKGTVMMGKYNNEVKVGQQKVMGGVTRMIFRSGASVDLGGMKVAGGAGDAGLADDVDNHFLQMFGTNFLIAGLAQVFQKDQGNVTVVNAGGGTNQLSNTAGQILSDTVRVINERNRAIPPTIYVFRGHKFNVMVNKDMVLPPQLTGVHQ